MCPDIEMFASTRGHFSQSLGKIQTLTHSSFSIGLGFPATGLDGFMPVVLFQPACHPELRETPDRGHTHDG